MRRNLGIGTLRRLQMSLLVTGTLRDFTTVTERENSPIPMIPPYTPPLNAWNTERRLCQIRVNAKARAIGAISILAIVPVSEMIVSPNRGLLECFEGRIINDIPNSAREAHQSESAHTSQ